jgi:predicted ATPase
MLCDSYFLRAESFYNVASEIERPDRRGGRFAERVSETAFFALCVVDIATRSFSRFAVLSTRTRTGYACTDELHTSVRFLRPLPFALAAHSW